MVPGMQIEEPRLLFRLACHSTGVSQQRLENEALHLNPGNILFFKGVLENWVLSLWIPDANFRSGFYMNVHGCEFSLRIVVVNLHCGFSCV